jgi:hypothetical protein
VKRPRQAEQKHEAEVLAQALAIMARRGGAARAKALTAARRRAIARKAGLASAAARKRKGGR